LKNKRASSDQVEFEKRMREKISLSITKTLLYSAVVFSLFRQS
jgi:hypothetical protein